MDRQRYDDPEQFLDAAGEFLFRDEVVNGVLIGVAGQAHHHTAEGETPYLLTLRAGERVCGVAVMTPPHRLLLNADPAHEREVLNALVLDLVEAGRSLPGVTGPVAIADAFTEAWGKVASFQLRRGMAMMVFELRQVRPPHGVSGHARWAAPTEEDLLVDWLDAFNAEVGQTPRPSLGKLREGVGRKIQQQDLLVWEDEGQPVSLAGRSRPSPRGTAINCVRTPAPCRRRGYASACVAELSQRILDEGKQFCTLFTDLANPTSNHIYQEIGYQSRGEFVELHFD